DAGGQGRRQGAPQALDELAGPAGTTGRVRGQAPPDRPVQGSGQDGVHPLPGDLPPRRRAGEQGDGGGGQPVDIGGGGGWLPGGDLGGHVAGRGGATPGVDQAEVDQHHLALGGEDGVVGLDVAVHDRTPVGVEVVEGLGKLSEV